MFKAVCEWLIILLRDMPYVFFVVFPPYSALLLQIKKYIQPLGTVINEDYVNLFYYNGMLYQYNPN